MTNNSSILFVCMGNICRSPTGEGVLGHLVRDRGLEDRIEIDSAGTIGYHTGNRADPRMRESALRRGFDLLSRSRQIATSDLDNFDLIIAMDRDNYQDILRLKPEPVARVKLLSEFLDDSWPTDVPDPYYGGEEGFEYVIDMIEAACPAILAELERIVESK